MSMSGRESRTTRLTTVGRCFPLLLLAVGGGVSPARAQAAPEMLGPGWHEPGEHEVPCDVVADPPDAAQLGSGGPMTRNPRVNERGKVTVRITSVRRRDRDGKLFGPSLVRPSENEQRCVVVLRDSGTYQVTTETTVDQWIWVRSEEASSVSALRLTNRPLAMKVEQKKYLIRVRGDCSRAEPPAPDAPSADPVTNRLRSALVKALSGPGQGVDGNSVTIESLESGGLWRFAVRINAQGCVLPSLDAMADCASPIVGPGTDLLIGSLQMAGGRSRINMRIVDAATTVISTASRGDAMGSDAGALERAAGDALRGLNFPLSCGRQE